MKHPHRGTVISKVLDTDLLGPARETQSGRTNKLGTALFTRAVFMVETEEGQAVTGRRLVNAPDVDTRPTRLFLSTG